MLEASALIWLAVTLEKTFRAVQAEAARAESNRQTAEKSRAEALAAAAEIEAAHRLREQDQARAVDERARANRERMRAIRNSESVKQNAANATEADQVAASTCAVADRGGLVVAQAVEAMSRIAESSHKIADIIAVIERSRGRPICSRSTPPSKRRGPAKPAAALPSSPPKSANVASAPRRRPRTSRI